jgi:hypothetical protein
MKFATLTAIAICVAGTANAGDLFNRPVSQSDLLMLQQHWQAGQNHSDAVRRSQEASDQAVQLQMLLLQLKIEQMRQQSQQR